MRERELFDSPTAAPRQLAFTNPFNPLGVPSLPPQSLLRLAAPTQDAASGHEVDLIELGQESLFRPPATAPPQHRPLSPEVVTNPASQVSLHVPCHRLLYHKLTRCTVVISRS